LLSINFGKKEEIKVNKKENENEILLNDSINFFKEIFTGIINLTFNIIIFIGNNKNNNILNNIINNSIDSFIKNILKKHLLPVMVKKIKEIKINDLKNEKIDLNISKEFKNIELLEYSIYDIKITNIGIDDFDLNVLKINEFEILL
jgi:hypothetical protein